jgi:hypothetical protein
MACGCSKKKLPNSGNNNMNRNSTGSRLAFNPADFVSRYYHGENVAYTGKSTGIVYQPRQTGTLVLVHLNDAEADTELFSETERKVTAKKKKAVEPEQETQTPQDVPAIKEVENAV